MPTAALVIWIATLVVVVLVVVPLAVSLLKRTLAAAWTIEAYLGDMRAAGAAIAEHTAHVAALEETGSTAAGMVPVAHEIETKTGTVAALLGARAGKEAGQ